MSRDFKTSPELRTSRLSSFFYLASFNVRDWSSIDSIRWGYFPNTVFFNLWCFSIIPFCNSNIKTHYFLFIRLEWKQSWIGPKILQQEQIISCLISSQVVWHFVPCSSIPELHFDWLMTFEFLQNFFMRFQKFSIN